MEDERRQAVKALAVEFLSRGDPFGWFDEYYRRADGNVSLIPWADKQANPGLVEWLRSRGGHAGAALVVGCGLGDDAELLARHGYQTAAFDISPTAVSWCRHRFPGSMVRYETADLFALPAAWIGAFGFVLEALTLQALPPALREAACRSIASAVRPGGRLLVICRGCDEGEDRPQIPWPVTRAELHAFESAGLSCEQFEDFWDTEDPPVRRFRVLYVRVTT